MGRHASQVFADLIPNELHRIEFRGTGWEVVYLQTGMLGHKGLNFLALMNGMVIPEQHDRATHTPEYLSQKRDHLLAGKGVTIGLDRQPQPATPRRHQQGTEQIEALTMPQARAYGWGLPARRPGAFEWRDQGKSAFIFKNQGGPLLTPLFLSAARHTVSTARWLGRHGTGIVVAVADSSSPAAVAYATPHWGDNARQTAPRLGGRFGPASNSLQHSLGIRPAFQRVL